MAYKTIRLSDEALDTLIELVTDEFDAIGRGEISYGSRDIDAAEAAHLTDIGDQLKTARDW